MLLVALKAHIAQQILWRVLFVYFENKAQFFGSKSQLYCIQRDFCKHPLGSCEKLVCLSEGV